MKKVFYLLLMLLSLSCSNGRYSQEQINQAKESLKFEAEMANKQLAGSWIDDMTRMLSCEFDGKNLEYTYEIDEDYATIDQLKMNKENMTTNLKNMWDNNPQLIVTKENLAKIKGKAIYNYVGNRTKKVMTITIDL